MKGRGCTRSLEVVGERSLVAYRHLRSCLGWDRDSSKRPRVDEVILLDQNGGTVPHAIAFRLQIPGD
jgi:hypothetical protein